MKDINYGALDPGIREVVRWLRGLNYETCDSGDGVSKPPAGRVLEYPHVFIRFERMHIQRYRFDTELEILLSVISRLANVQVGPVGSDQVWIQGTYDPYDHTYIAEVANLRDSMLPWYPKGEKT